MCAAYQIIRIASIVYWLKCHSNNIALTRFSAGHQRNNRHLVQLKRQMCEMEQRRAADRRRVFEEGLYTRIQDAQRQQQLVEHKKRKLEELR